ncbi:MAG: SulP family inorganic anion transporter [Caldilinea sp.]
MQSLRPTRSNLQSDAIAGLTFAVVNVPQAMAHALLATVNPVLGIYTLMVAVPTGAIFTSSVFMNVSTTGALSLAAGAGLAGIPDAQRASALVTLVLLVGLIQALSGLFRLGFIVRFVSNSVMTGFLNGLAVLIILGQLGELTGFESRFANNVVRSLNLLLRPSQVDLPSTIIGGLTLALIVLLLFTRLRRFAFIIAISVATVLLTLMAIAGAGLDWQSVRTVGDIATIPRSLPSLALPSPALLPSLFLPALSVAIIGLIQGAGVSQGYPNPDGKYPDVSRDFLGQGVANLATSFVSGLPAGGSISGTALMLSAGARSRWANILAGVFVAAVVFLAAPLAELVPMPALAALLIVAGYQGLRIEAAVTIWNTSKTSATVMGLTFLATLFLPLQYAVLLGVAFSIVMHVAHQSNKVIITQWTPIAGGFPLESPAPRTLPSHRLTLLQIYGSVFFAAAKNLEQMLPTVDNTDRAVVALTLRGRTEIGSTFITVLRRYAQALHARNSRLMLVGVDTVMLDLLTKTGLLQLIGAENVFLATPQLGEAMNQAIAAANSWLDQAPDNKAPQKI